MVLIFSKLCKIKRLLRQIYAKDDKTSDLDEIKSIAFEGTAPERYAICINIGKYSKHPEQP